MSNIEQGTPNDEVKDEVKKVA